MPLFGTMNTEQGHLLLYTEKSSGVMSSEK